MSLVFRRYKSSSGVFWCVDEDFRMVFYEEVLLSCHFLCFVGGMEKVNGAERPDKIWLFFPLFSLDFKIQSATHAALSKKIDLLGLALAVIDRFFATNRFVF